MKNRRQEHLLNPRGTATRAEIATIPLLVLTRCLAQNKKVLYHTKRWR